MKDVSGGEKKQFFSPPPTPERFKYYRGLPGA
jgi:hypothetical protein